MPQYELNLRDYLRIFRKRRFTIIATFVLTTFVSFVYISSQPVIYKAKATVKIEQGKSIAGLLTEWIIFNPADVMESETKFISGYPIMKKVALRMGKIQENSSLEEINQAVGQLQGGIETERIANTNMISITASSTDPKEARDLANYVADVYIEENLLEKAKQATHARQFIEEQLASLEHRLLQAEDRMKEFGDEFKNIKLAAPIEEKLVDLQFKLAELMQKYTDQHPRVIQIKDQIKDMESQVQGFSGQELEYARLSREVEVNKKLYAMLKEKLEEARITEAQKVGDVSLVNPAVLPGAPSSGGRGAGVFLGGVLGLMLGLVMSFVLETLDTSIGTIEDVEAVVKLPVLGVVPSIEPELKTKKGLFVSLKNRVFPAPRTEAEDKFIRLVSHFRPRSSAAEAYRNIHTNLKLNPARKSILVTSSGPREGKTSAVTNLGIVMAQAGLRTLLVSSDLRRPTLSKAFGIKREPGLHELLMGTETLEGVLNNITDIMVGDMQFEDITKTPGIENIWIIPAGRIPSNPVELLSSREVDQLLVNLRSRFDVIIFDSPPVLPVTDASLLAPKMDCVVIVYEIGRTGREALMRTKIQLESVGAKIVGVVLNNTRTQTEVISNYPYYHYKYKYYGKDSDKEKIT